MTPLSHALCFTHTTSDPPNIRQGRAGYLFQPPPWELFSLSTGHSKRKEVLAPGWALLGTYHTCQALPLAQACSPWGTGMYNPIAHMGKPAPLKGVWEPWANDSPLCAGSGGVWGWHAL